MADSNRCAKINVKVLLILILIAAALGTSLIAARHVRRKLRSEMELKAGQAAFDKGDWFNANRHLGAYISLNPDDVEILKKLAKSKMSIRPIGPFVGGAIATYRRILQLEPEYEETYDQLAVLYKLVGNFEELEHVALRRIELDPNDDDREAQLWLADARIQRGKLDGPDKAHPDDRDYYEKVGARQILDGLTKIEPSEDVPPESVYVQACLRMSNLAAGQSNPEVSEEWLDKAIEHSDPNSVEALALRASLRRKSNDPVGAGKDLDEADKIGTDNPRIRAFLCEEWMLHGKFGEAARQLAAVEKLREESAEAFHEHYVDPNEWQVTRFILASQLAMRQGDATGAASLADDALAKLTEDRHRIRILDPAIISYVAAGRAVDANSCLDDYRDAMRGVTPTTESQLRGAYLEAMVARAKGAPYEIIEILQPILVEGVPDFKLWRLLAEAYSTTGQTRRAISALERYLLLQPNDSQARMQKVAEHLRLGDWAAVLEDAQRAESLTPEDSEARLIAQLLRIEASANIAAADKQSGAEKLAALQVELDKLEEDHRDRVDIRILQAIVADGLGQPDAAEKVLEQARRYFQELDKATDYLKATMQLVRHYRFKRDPRAIELCKEMCEDNPELAAPLLELSNLHILDGDPNEACRVIKAGLPEITDDAERRGLTMRLAWLELIYGPRADGIERLKALRKQDENDILVRSWLLRLPEVLDGEDEKCTPEQLVDELRNAEGEGGLQWRFYKASLVVQSSEVSTDTLLLRQAELEDYLQYCIDADPNWVDPVLVMGRMYSIIGNLQRAEDTYRRSLMSGRAAPQVLNALFALLNRRGRLADAGPLIDRLREQFRISPEEASALNRGLINLGSGNLDQAIKEMEFRRSNEPDDPNLPSALAWLVYERDGDYARAKTYLDEAEAKDPNSECMALIEAKVSILREEGMYEEAREALDTYVTNVPKDKIFHAYVLRAAFLTEVGEIERAEGDYRKLASVSGQGATGYLRLGEFYAQNQDFDKAVTTFEEGLTTYASDLRLKRGLAAALYSRGGEGDFARADAALGELEARLPNDPGLMTISARRLLQLSLAASLAGEDPNSSLRRQAENKLRRAVRLEPTAIDAQLLLFRILVADGEYAEAREVSVRAIGSNPRSPELALARAEIELAVQNRELALQNAKLASQLSEAILLTDPNSPVALRALAGAAELSKDADLCQNAIAKLEAYGATEKGRNSISNAVAIANLYLLIDNEDQARQWVQGAEETYLTGETEFNDRVLLAKAMYQTGDADGAKNLYRESLKQDPNNVEILNNLAWVLQDSEGDYEAALKFVDAALKNSRAKMAVRQLLDTRGTILMKMNRSADARKDFEQFLALSPMPAQEAKAHLELGRICDKLGESADAKRHFERAQTLDRRNDVFTDDERAEISRLLQRSGS